MINIKKDLSMFAQILFCNLIKFAFSQLALRWRHIVDVAVAIAVTKVEYHPNSKPDTSPDPGFLRQKRHHKQAGKPGKQR